MRHLVFLLPACVPAGLDGFIVSVEGSVIDADGAPLAGAEVHITGDTGDVLGVATTDDLGAWSFPLYGDEDQGNTLRATASASGFATAYAEWEVNLLSAQVTTLRAGPVQDWEPVHRPLACMRLDDEGETLAGRIVDPSGVPVEGLDGVLQRGWNAPVGAASIGNFRTNGEGEFSVTVEEPGLYTAYVAPADGWAGTRFPAFTHAEMSPVEAVVAPAQAPGHLLAAVLWAGATDLDLHLTAPARDTEARTANQRFHVWADAPLYPERLGDGEEPLAELVRSATSGPGPEVIVVNTPAGAGELRLSVVDRSHEEEADAGVLGQTAALVQWWNGEDTPRYAWVSPLQTGNAWRPVEIDTRSADVFTVEAYASAVLSTDPDSF